MSLTESEVEFQSNWRLIPPHLSAIEGAMDVANRSTVVYFKIAHLGRQPLPISFYHSRLPNTQCAFRFNPADLHQKID